MLTVHDNACHSHNNSHKGVNIRALSGSTNDCNGSDWVCNRMLSTVAEQVYWHSTYTPI